MEKIHDFKIAATNKSSGYSYQMKKRGQVSV
jgi:hypothetical protein